MQINSSLNNSQVTRKVQDKIKEYKCRLDLPQIQRLKILSMTLLKVAQLLCNWVLETHCIRVKLTSVILFVSMEPNLLRTTGPCLVTFHTD